MHTITLINGKRFVTQEGSSLLDAALASGLILEHSCRTGRCGSCKTRLLTGSAVPMVDEVSLTPEEIDRGWILTCAREASSDASLDAEDLSALQGITPKTLPCRISAIEMLAADVLKVVLRLPPNAGFAFRAGQYVDVSGPGAIKRSYSVASSMADPSKIELHVRRVEGGAMSRYWFDDAKVNDLLRFRGPLGTFFLRDVAGLDLIFLATGTGYAPVHSMLDHVKALDKAERPRSTSIYWGGRIPDDIYAIPSVAPPSLRFVPVASRADSEWDGERGHVQDVLLRHGLPLADAAVYACGSDAMIHAARNSLAAAGLNPRRFYSDAFVSSN